MMNIPCAWTLTNGDPSIVVVVADFFANEQYRSHDDLVGKVVEHIGNCTDPPGEHHGIQSLGAIAGIRNNGKCVAGVGGDTRVAAFCGQAIFSLNPITERGHKIVSISRGTPLASQTKNATENGTVVLIFGRNNDHKNVRNIPGVIHIGRTYLNGDWWEYDDTNAETTMEHDVLVVTQGTGRMIEANGCQALGGQGTSLGTPMAAGVVALMRSVNPCLSPPDVENIIKSTAGPIPSNATPEITASGIINAYDAVLAAQNFIPTDQEWNTSQQVDNAYVSGDLDILSGAHVTIEGNVYMGPESELTIHPLSRLTVTGSINFAEGARCIVKRNALLEVDGGKLTSSWCSDQWQGVIVEGDRNKEQSLVFDRPHADQDPRAGMLTMTNGAVIEHAKIGVSMFASHLPYPEKLQYFGGHIRAENSTFRENEKAVAFGKYLGKQLGFKDKSSFTNMHFIDHKHATTHWANEGVVYDNCVFEAYETSAITTIDAAIEVINGCEFHSTGHIEYNQAGITIANTVPLGRASKIGDLASHPNQYFGGSHGIHGIATAGMSKTEVINNIFIGGLTGINFDGSSNWRIENNDFIGPVVGTKLISNGGYENFQINNNISSCDYGILAHFDNRNYQFLSNCFAFTNKRDFYLNGQQFPTGHWKTGKIRPNQGSSNEAASNVFTINTSARGIEIRESDIPAYHILQGVPTTDTRVPGAFYPGNIFDAANERALDCGSTGSGVLITDQYNCQVPTSQAEIDQAIDDIEDLIEAAELELSGETEFSYDWYYFNFLITEYKDCLYRLKMRLMEVLTNEEAYQSLADYFEDDELFYKAIAFGILFDDDQNNLASNFLLSFNGSGQEEIDFVFTQQLNLARAQTSNYEISESDMQALFFAGHRLKPLNGFSRSLYFLLTGEKIELDIDMEDEGSENRLSKAIAEEELKVTPNPFSSEIVVNLDERSNNNPVDIAIYNINGNEMYYNQVNADMKEQIRINTNDFEVGIYFVVVRNSTTKELISMKRIMKL